MKSLFKLLYEADEPLDDYVIGSLDAEVTTKNPALDSVDYQIDQFLIEYEREAIAAAAKNPIKEDSATASLHNANLSFLLEQEDDPFAEEDDPFADEEDTGEPAEAEEAEEVEEEMPVDASDIKATEPADLPTPKMNMSVFVSSLNRLLASFCPAADDVGGLLLIEPVIINRAKNYLEKNYGELHVKKFEEIMNQDGRLNITQDKRVELEDEPFQVGAFAGGTGGLGGGAA